MPRDNLWQSDTILGSKILIERIRPYEGKRTRKGDWGDNKREEREERSGEKEGEESGMVRST